MSTSRSDGNEPFEAGDTLLALALAFGSFGPRRSDESPVTTSWRDDVEPLYTLSSLETIDREAIERRSRWLEERSHEEVGAWIATELKRARAYICGEGALLDASVHASHVADLLR